MRLAFLLVATLLVTTACSGDDASPGSAGAAGSEPSSTRSLFSLTPVPQPPEQPPSGTLIADIQQSSRDGALNRFEVWVDNDTTEPITPTQVTYHDDRFRTPMPGTRLRDIPAQARRGFPIYQPDRPACDHSATDTATNTAGTAASGTASGTVTVEYTVHGQHQTTTVPVSDEAEVIARITSARCLELAVAQIAHLSWADQITTTDNSSDSSDGGQAAEGSVGTMTLVIDTTGTPGPTLVIDTIVGNPVLSPGTLGVYDAHLTITGDQPPQRIPVPVTPTRCDLHAFGESGSFGAFAFNVHIDGQPGQFVLRMGTTAAKNAIDYAKASCGFLTTPTGGEG